MHDFQLNREWQPELAATPGQPFSFPRGEGLCSKCGVNPKYVAPGGGKYSWCYACRKASDRKRLQARGQKEQEVKDTATQYVEQNTPTTTLPCNRCGANPRAVDYRGKTQSLCVECRRAKKNKWYHEHASTAAREKSLVPVEGQSPTPTPRLGRPPKSTRIDVDAQPNDLADIITGMVLLATRVRPLIQEHNNTALRMSLEADGVALKIGVERTDEE